MIENLYAIRDKMQNNYLNSIGFNKGDFDHIISYALDFCEARVYNGLMITTPNEGVGALSVLEGAPMELFMGLYKMMSEAYPPYIYHTILDLEFKLKFFCVNSPLMREDINFLNKFVL